MHDALFLLSSLCIKLHNVSVNYVMPLLAYHILVKKHQLLFRMLWWWKEKPTVASINNFNCSPGKHSYSQKKLYGRKNLQLLVLITLIAHKVNATIHFWNHQRIVLKVKISQVFDSLPLKTLVIIVIVDINTLLPC